MELLIYSKLFDILHIFCQPQKKSLPKSLTQKKSLQNVKPKKSPQIANFKPKKGIRTVAAGDSQEFQEVSWPVLISKM